MGKSASDLMRGEFYQQTFFIHQLMPVPWMQPAIVRIFAPRKNYNGYEERKSTIAGKK
jgi:hypothetical protein